MSAGYDPVKGPTYYVTNFSCFVRLLPYSEQSAVYNAVNFSLTQRNVDNITVAAIRLSILIVPQRPQRPPADRQRRRTPTSGSTPTRPTPRLQLLLLELRRLPGDLPQQQLPADFQLLGPAGPDQRRDLPDAAINIAAITDGTSNTIIFGEHVKALLPIYSISYSVSDYAWYTGNYYDTQFTTLYPPNVGTSSTAGITPKGLGLLLPDRRRPAVTPAA